MPCPRCGYSLRDLTSTRCPECSDELRLRVGLATPRFGWLVAAMAPGLFSGVCATLLLFPLVIMPWFTSGASRPPGLMYLTEAFGIASFVGAVAIYRYRRAFLARPDRRQAAIAAGIWGVHVLAFVLLLVGLA